MKSLIYICFFICGCKPATQSGKDIIQVEFSTLSRTGHAETVIIRPDSVLTTIEERRSGSLNRKSRRTEKSEWENLLKTIPELKEIQELKSPTNARAFDGANHSEIKIKSEKNDTVTHLFDNEDPHEKLHKLMEVIRETGNKK
jgi:hypothetical protein